MNELIKKAKEFATKAHERQFRKDGVTPYITHPEAVYNLLICSGIKNENILCAAWLHDVVEDCGIKVEEIEEKFNPNIASLVSSLSEGDSREEYNQKIKYSSKKVKLIKLADTIHNCADIYSVHISEKTRTRKITDSIEMYLPMAKEIYEPFYHLLKHHVDKREEFWKNGKVRESYID